MAEITMVADSSWVLDSSQNDVVVSDHTGGPALTSGDFSKLVRLAGTVMSEGTSCGGTAFCHDFDYGAGQSIVFRHWGGERLSDGHLHHLHRPCRGLPGPTTGHVVERRLGVDELD